jgi:L-amino acid N-acyltransferase YncA
MPVEMRDACSKDADAIAAIYRMYVLSSTATMELDPQTRQRY